MEMLKISGDDDFAACQFEGEFDPALVLADMVAKNESDREIELEDGTIVYAELLQFKTPEEVFDYYKDHMQDYDDSKNTNYYRDGV